MWVVRFGSKFDLKGAVFGRLRVVSFSHRNKKLTQHWACLCECGTKTIVSGYHLRMGETRSCGCFARDVATKNLTTHGQASKLKGSSRAYKTWVSMRRRCRGGPATHSYRYYRALGVTVCKRWVKFENFFEDMGERPEGHTLDRIDPYGNYSKKNCRWATPETQRLNQRKRVPVGFHNLWST